MIKQITQGKSAFFPGSRYLWVALRAPRLLRSCLENPLRILNNNPARHTSEHTQRVKAISCRELRAAHGPHTVVARPNTGSSADGPQMLVQSLASPGTRQSSPEIGSRPAHISCTAVHSGTTTAHTPSLLFCTCVCHSSAAPPCHHSPAIRSYLTFTFTLTSHPLILDTRAAVAPCPPAKVTAMVDNAAATSDLDGTP